MNTQWRSQTYSWVSNNRYVFCASSLAYAKHVLKVLPKFVGWSREKLTIAKLVKKLPAIYATRKSLRNSKVCATLRYHMPDTAITLPHLNHTPLRLIFIFLSIYTQVSKEISFVSDFATKSFCAFFICQESYIPSRPFLFRKVVWRNFVYSKVYFSFWVQIFSDAPCSQTHWISDRLTVIQNI